MRGLLLVLLCVSHASASECAAFFHKHFSCLCHMVGAIVQEKALDVQRGTQGEDDSQCSAWTAGVGGGSQAKKGKRGVDVGNWLQQSDVRADPPLEYL